MVNFIIGVLIFVLGIIFIGSILFLIFNIKSLLILILFIPGWLIILLFEIELIWTIIFLMKKEPFNHLSKTSGNHEKILKDYLNTLKQKENLEIIE